MSDGKVIIKIDGDSGSFERELQSVTKTAKTALAAVGATATAAAAAIYKVGAAFETSMAKVSTIADTSRASMNQLTNGVIKLSNETGVAADQLADAMYNAISASVDTADAVDFTAQAVKLAKGGFTDAASAVDVMTTVLNSYGLAASEASRVSDVLIQVQNKGKTTVNELASNMGRVIPTASAYGVSLENLGAAYARMTANGVATAETTTYINSMLNELGKSGTDASNALKEISGKTFKQLMESGMSLGEVLALLEDHAKASGLSISDMFGSAEAGKAALTLLSKGVDGFNQSLADMQSSAGLTETAFETMAGTAENSAEIIKNKFKNLGIDIYNQNSDSIDAMMTSIGNLADEAIDFAQTAAPKAADAITWIIDNADALAITLKSAVTAVIAFKTTTLALTAIFKTSAAIKAANLVVTEYAAVTAGGASASVLLAGTLKPLELIIGVFTGKVKLATAAQVAFNAAKKASVGLIGLAVAAISAMVAGLVSYAKNADTAANRTKKVKEEVAALKDEYESAKKAAEDNAEAERTQILEADKLIARLKELDSIMKSGALTTDEYTAAANELRTVADKLNAIFPDLKIGIDEETGALDTQLSKVTRLYSAYKDLYLLKIQSSIYEEQLTAAGKALLAAQETLENTPGPVEVRYYTQTARGYTGQQAFTSDLQRNEAHAAAAQAVADAQAEYDRLFQAILDTEAAYSSAVSKIEQKGISENLSTDAARTEKFLASTCKAVKSVTKEVELSYEDQLKALERSHKLKEVSDAKYYAELEKLRDEYLDESSDEWLDLTVKINDYHEQVAESAADAAERAAEEAEEAAKITEAAIEEASKGVQKTSEEIISAYDAAVGALAQKQQSFAAKMLATGALIEKKTKTYDFGGRYDAVSVEYTELADLDKQAADMQAYADALEAVKNRGALPAGFFAELRDMSVEEGLQFANTLLRASDEEFAAYLESWQKKKDLADDISKEIYADEASALKTALEAEFGQVPEDFFNLGEDSAEKYGEGFMEKLPALMGSIKAQITAGLAAILPGITATTGSGTGGNTYNTSYYVQPSAGESTQAQLLALQSAEKINDQRGQ